MKYDDASWHSGGNFPADLPPEAGGTHIALLLAWALLSGLEGEMHAEEGAIEKLRARTQTPGEFFFEQCDGKLTHEDFNADGNAFVAAYYDLESADSGYLADYDGVFTGLPSLYHVEDSWKSYDRLSPVLDARLEAWRTKKS